MELIPIGMSRNGRDVHLARPETIEAFHRMSVAARREKVFLCAIWAYRSPALQREQFREAQHKHGRREGIRWLAPPGFSEHQTGWALDIGDEKDMEADDNPLFERTAAFRWLRTHAAEFGFELSFLAGNWQGVNYEPWHWRYVGTPQARRAFRSVGLRAGLVWGRSFMEAIRRWAMW